jgi:hypothetical protein
LDTRHRKIDTDNIGHKTQKDVQCYLCLSFCVLCPMLPVSIFLCIVPNGSHVYLYVFCVQCYTCLSVCALCPLLPVSIFLCLVPNVAVFIFLCLLSNVSRVYLSVSCVQCYPCLSLCVLCPMLHVFIFLCLVSNVLDKGNIGHKTQKDRHM